MSRRPDSNIFSSEPLPATASSARYNGKNNTSSICFGASEEQVVKKPHNHNASSFSFGGQEEVEVMKPSGRAAVQQQQQQYNQNVDMGNLGALHCHDGKGGVGSGRVSTKVHAPPGGKSSFSIGGGYGNDDVPQQQNSRFSGKGNTTSFSLGGGSADDAPQQNSRFSGKGNTSQISFGAYDEAPAAKGPNRNASSFSLGNDADVSPAAAKIHAAVQHHQQQQQDYSNLPALSCHDGRGGVGGGKFSTKVHAPPGGRSQISFY